MPMPARLPVHPPGTIVTDFNNAVSPALPSAGTVSGSNPLVTVTWTNNGTNGEAGDPPGLYLTLTGSLPMVSDRL